MQNDIVDVLLAALIPFSINWRRTMEMRICTTMFFQFILWSESFWIDFGFDHPIQKMSSVLGDEICRTYSDILQQVSRNSWMHSCWFSIFSGAGCLDEFDLRFIQLVIRAQSWCTASVALRKNIKALADVQIQCAKNLRFRGFYDHYACEVQFEEIWHEVWLGS